MALQEFFIIIAEHVLSVAILCFITLSFAYAAVYFIIFVIQPHDPKKSEEQILLLNKPKTPPQCTPPTNGGHHIDYSVHIQMAAVALVYSAIQAGRLNSNKVLMQLSWESYIDNSVLEVMTDECTAIHSMNMF